MKPTIYLLMFFMLCSVGVNAQIDIESIDDKEDTEVVDEADVSDEESETPAVEEKASKGITSYSKFDFIPGEKVIFFDDFTQDPVGEFPAKWNTNNNGEVVTVSGVKDKWFKLPAEGGNYFPELKLTFPDNVTIEFDVLLSEQNTFVITYYSEASFDVDAYGVPGEAGAEVMISSEGHEFKNYDTGDQGINTSSSKGEIEPGKPAHVSVWIQKSRFRMYVNEVKVFDIPKGVFTDFKYNRFRFETSNTKEDVNISNVRIAVGAPDTRNQLIAEGKLVTRGILFDVNSDKIKPQSYACIKGIADVLKENPSVNVQIVGHTDSDGDEAKNLDLSQRRAASVKAFLTREFNIDDTRMKTDGKGEGQPIDNNSTAEGKAQNRRVEFIKM
ncbi:MAG TPA: OmpA family protein [Prolixibacteraceae bacterium]|nr:OmpA family protein [Prolixibacteraceae bacterium]HQN93969.1 OmpA family protein [Prolixibacteraceae bacterium]